jgi:branched-chain amino acid transport system ATP-binding protein
MTERLLEAGDLTMRFGGVTALDTVRATSTAARSSASSDRTKAEEDDGLQRRRRGVRADERRGPFHGQEHRGLEPQRDHSRGVARTFQNIRLFREMTALENVMVGADAHHRTSVPGAIIRFGRHRAEEADGHERGMQLLEFMGIARRWGEAARNLPYGDQRRLEIAGRWRPSRSCCCSTSRRGVQPGREAKPWTSS